MTYSPRQKTPVILKRSHNQNKNNERSSRMRKAMSKKLTLTQPKHPLKNPVIMKKATKPQTSSLSSISQSDSLLYSPQSTGLVYDERMLKHKHEWFIEEQESPHRIQQAFQRCVEENLVSRCIRVPAYSISEDDLALVHDKSYITKIKKSANMSHRELYALSGQYDGVFFNQSTWLCAKLAAGSVKHLAQLVFTGKLTNGLALVRPPGHHAMQSEACGYCIFNNIAVAAASFLQPRKLNSSSTISKPKDSLDGEVVSAQRILIVDWDVHHGQGTQYTFYDDNRVLFISIHRYENGGFWPNLREANYDFIGKGSGKGYNINIPLEEIGMTDSDYLAIFHQIIMPIATEFNPQLVLISCGFDAAIGCPEGRMWLSPMVFGHFVHELKSLAGGKVVVVLEGGYFVDSLAEGIVHVLKGLLGDPLSPIQLIRPPCKSVKHTIELCTVALRNHWKSIGYQDVSKTIPRPSLKHLPIMSWSLMKVIAWPETNPQLPRVLTKQIQKLLVKHFPAPLAIPVDSHGGNLKLTLVLIPSSSSSLSSSSSSLVSSLSVSSSSAAASTPSTIIVKQKGVSRKRQRQQEQRNSATHSLLQKLSEQVHIHLYDEHDLLTTDYHCRGPTKKSRVMEFSRSTYTQQLAVTRHINQTNDDHIDDIQSMKQFPSVDKNGKPLKVLQNDSIQSECNCPFYVISPKGQIIKHTDYRKGCKKEVLPNLKTALSQALISALMQEFHTLYIAGSSLTFLHLIEAVTQIPLNFLSNYREGIFRPRYFQPNRSNSNGNSGNNVNNELTNTFRQLKGKSLTNSPSIKNETLRQLVNVYSYPHESIAPSAKITSSSCLPPSALSSVSPSCLPSSKTTSSSSPSATSSFSSPLKNDNNSYEKSTVYHFIKSEDFYTKPCRLLVLDISGVNDLENINLQQEINSLPGPLSQNIQCDLIWCSVYHGELAHQLIKKPNELRAKELHNAGSTSMHKDRINNLIWLKIPIPTKTNSSSLSRRTLTNLETVDRKGKKNTSPTASDSNTSAVSLLSIIYHIILPISYEFGPDLVCLLIGSYEDNQVLITPDTIARIIYLLNGLGAVVLVGGTTEQLCCEYIVQSLLGKPLPVGFNELDPSSPSFEIKQVIQMIMQQNHQRWKSLKFSGSLPTWV
ncbi:unnamed protein product [Heterobilharzia americana]|nr:unnamed protein product [Heterobilharzia americana]